MKNKKLIVLITSLCLVVAVTVVGVLALTSATQTTSISISYTAKNVTAQVNITATKYVWNGTAYVGSAITPSADVANAVQFLQANTNAEDVKGPSFDLTGENEIGETNAHSDIVVLKMQITQVGSRGFTATLKVDTTSEGLSNNNMTVLGQSQNSESVAAGTTLGVEPGVNIHAFTEPACDAATYVAIPATGLVLDFAGYSEATGIKSGVYYVAFSVTNLNINADITSAINIDFLAEE